MVWGLFPVDPLPGENNYYFSNKGTYKVGRKGCDIIVNKDKTVSRIHAEIVIDEMIYLEKVKKHSDVASKVRIRDCSKYGTFIGNKLTSKVKVHEFPSKETTLNDGDLVSFGTGSAVYRFSFVPLVFFICSPDKSRASQLITKNISAIGAGITRNWSATCSHVLVEDSNPLKEGLVDAIVAKKPFVKSSWVELIAGNSVLADIPSCNSHAPTLMFDGAPVKVVTPEIRENCLKIYNFILESIDMYKLKEKLQSLLEASGAKVSSIETFCPNSQGMEEEGNKKTVLVIPVKPTSSQYSHDPSLSRVNEMDLVAAAISGHLDPSLVISPPAHITSCPTDEIVVADSDAETGSDTESDHDTIPVCILESDDEEENKETTAIHAIKSVENNKKHEIKSMEDDHERVNSYVAAKSIEHDGDEIPDNNSSVKKLEGGQSKRVNSYVTAKSIKHDGDEIPDSNSSVVNLKGGQSKMLGVKAGIKTSNRSETDNSQSGNSDIIYSQALIIRDYDIRASVNPTTNGVTDFKRFRKTTVPSGNSFSSLVPFSKFPYKESDYDNEEVVESLKEEKKRKQMEARAEDLFNDEKKKRIRAVGSLHGVFARA
ncbi:hypothetical protein DM860_004707 [Cuscuta australis]|uniref:FHA domain-containing protein n=1 Tax=Cuscuta australis TaxID=267555 RepID=A0A328DP42_9ASTE|nr:hypothetical protein DM860_004707 [Cuscuta australis]